MVNVPSEVRDLNPGFDWGDADRVQVLYAPMRSRDLNPESHDAKVRLAKVQIFYHWYIAKT